MDRIRTWLVLPRPWWVAHGTWIAIMLIASSVPVELPEEPRLEIPHLDKVMHFGWFCAGGLILAVAMRLQIPDRGCWWWRMLLPVLWMSSLGALDEFRQSFTPGRNGNDPGDWFADSLGGLAGVWLANRAAMILRQKSSRNQG